MVYHYYLIVAFFYSPQFPTKFSFSFCTYFDYLITLNELVWFFQKTTQETLIRQNIELKASAVEANETIYQMGIMYMRLKKSKSLES